MLPPVPYQLAQFWDKGLRELHHTRTHPAQQQHTPSEPQVGHVPRDLRATAKRTPAVKSWLRVLEEPVRQFVVERGLAVVAAADAAGDGGESSDETDPEDEEIVFVGRGGGMRDGKPWKRAERKVGKEEGEGERGMVMDGMEEGEGGAFKCVILCLCLSYLFSFPAFFYSLGLTAPLQTLAHALHLGLLRPRLQVGHGGHSRAARHLRRRAPADPEAEAEAEAGERGKACPG